MGYAIKQSQTDVPLLFFMVDSTDHVTPKTGLTPTVTLSKNGGSFASPAGAVTEIGNGWYKVAANATDAATLGPLVLYATGTAADPATVEFFVVSYDSRDAVRLGLTAIPNAAAGANGGLPTGDGSGRVAVQVGTGTGQINLSSGKVPATIAAGDIATDAITAAAIAAAAVTKIQTGLSTYAGGDTSGVTTLLARLTSTRAGLLDYLDAAISTRLASASYTSPPSAATIAAAVEAAILNEGDSQAVLDAIVAAIAAANPDLGNLTLNAIAEATAALLLLNNGVVDTMSDSIAAMATNYARRTGDYATPASVAALPTAAAIATQVDTTLSAEHGSGQWGAAAGDGPCAVTITLSPVVADARVTLKIGATTYSGTSNASGQVVFNAISGTGTLKVSYPGYSYSPTTHTIDGTESLTATLVALTLPESTNPDTTRAYLTTRDASGNVLAGVKITFELQSGDLTDGNSFNLHTSVTSDEDGLLEIDLLRGQSYKMWSGGKTNAVTFSTGSEASFELPALLCG